MILTLILTFDVVLVCTILVSGLMIFSALPGQYLCFCRNEFLVLMEYATSENCQRGNPGLKILGPKLKGLLATVRQSSDLEEEQGCELMKD